MIWIFAEDIVGWVERQPKDAQQLLPRFIKRLILSHGDAVLSVEMPDGEGTADHGWDGIVSFSGVSRFVPDGPSAWEIGTDRSVKTKADKDFEKRSGNPLSVVPADTTYVFVSPRKFEKKASWVREKRALGIWKDVHALSARDLEDWFTLAPAVAREFALHIGKYAGNVRSLEEFWKEWSAATDPKISSAMVLAGRADAAAQVATVLSDGATQTVVLAAETIGEATAFVHAAATTLEEGRRDKVLSSVLLCDNENAVRSTALLDQNLTVILPATLGTLVGTLRDAGKSVIVVDHVKFGTDTFGIVLEPPWRHDFKTALEQNGFTGEEATQVAAQTGASLSAYRRLKAVAIAGEPGSWDAGESAPLMVPAVLAGQWLQSDTVSDWCMLEKLALPRDIVAEGELRKLLHIEAPPLRNEGQLWALSSPSDAFLAMGPYITEKHLDAFHEVALEVLTELDPRFELDATDRYAARVFGKSHRFSGSLRKGLARSMCLIATRLADVGGYAGSSRMNWLAKDILKSISAHGVIGWSSIGDISPLLAEAAPSVFLNAVEFDLNNNPDTFIGLMTDEKNGFGLGACLHSGLLWALETQTWFSEHMPRAALALARLAEIDPGGRWGNRPLGSLSDLFLPWKQHSCSSPNRRLAVIDQIIDSYPETAWQLLIALGSKHFTSGLRFPDWRPITPTTVSDEDFRRYWSEVGKRYIKMGYSTPKRMAKLVNGRPRLTNEDRKAAINHILTLDRTTISADAIAELREAARNRLYFINSFEEPDQINAEEVEALNNAYAFLAPEDPVDRHLWLFTDGWPDLPSGERQNYEAYTAKVDDARTNAAREVLDQCGIDRALMLASDDSLGGRFAHAVGKAAETKLDGTIIDRLAEDITELYPLALSSFACGRVSTYGEDWALGQIEHLRKLSNAAKKLAAIALALPTSKATWDRVEDLGTEPDDRYWAWVTIWSVGEETEYAVSKLLHAGRILEAVDVAAMGKEHVSSLLILEVIHRTIQELSAHEEPVKRNTFTFHLEELFECLDGRTDVSANDIVPLEFPFARTFDHMKRGLKAHDDLLANNPAYFAEIVSWAYKADSGVDDDESGLTEEQLQNRASNAFSILESLRFAPGSTPSGFDPTKGAEWLKEVKEQLSQRNRADSGNHALAEVVQRIPVGDNGNWPPEGILDAIENLSCECFDGALHTAFFNARGVTTRSFDDGGDQERELAAKYRRWADAIDVVAPRVASVLRALARTYDRHGRDEDSEVKVRKIVE